MPHDHDASASDVLARLRALSDDAEFFQDLGKTFSRHKLYGLAKSSFELSLELDPCDGFTHLYLGNWYYRERQFEPALECFEYASQLMPDVSAPFWCMADVYEELKRFDEAEELHCKALAVDPNDKQARQMYRRFRQRRPRRRKRP